MRVSPRTGPGAVAPGCRPLHLMRFLLFLFLATLLAGCVKSSGPLKTYFIGAARFTSGNRTANPADTLATRLYVDATSAATQGLKNLRVTVDYSPRRAPFLYPTPLTSFSLSSVTPSTEQLVYLDSTYTSALNELLYTTVYSVRTTTGTERWTFTATDNAGNMSARTFVISQRRSDSTAVYNDYTLKLAVPATGRNSRRFLDLKSGLALAGFTVHNNPDLQKLTDIIVLTDGLTLASPDALAAPYFGAGTWPAANRSTTRFFLTSLTPTTFSGVTDVLSLQQAFVAPGLSQVSGLTMDQVYAVAVTNGTSGTQYGLIRIVSVPAGTTAGLQMEIRMAKPAL